VDHEWGGAVYHGGELYDFGDFRFSAAEYIGAGYDDQYLCD
jgi:hypothetical protein